MPKGFYMWHAIIHLIAIPFINVLPLCMMALYETKLALAKKKLPHKYLDLFSTSNVAVCSLLFKSNFESLMLHSNNFL